MPKLLNLNRFRLDRFAGVGDEETFAIGDIHGRADLLELALAAIEATPKAEGRPRRLVTLGDYVDRGPEGVRVIDMLMGADARLGFPVTPLLGNHEQMVISTTSEDIPAPMRLTAANLWLGNGGNAVIEELGGMGADVDPLTLNGITAALGPDRIAFLNGLGRCFRPPGGDVMFVHAGLNPYVPLDAFLANEWRYALAAGRLDESRDPSWVRDAFLEHMPSRTSKVGHHGMFVVHGHTPQDGMRRPQAEQVRHDRINLDNYAVFTGRLRLARMVGNVLETFEVGDRPGEGA